MTTPTADPRPQHIKALTRANEVRLQRAETKHWISDAPSGARSRARCAELLEAPPPHVATMPIFDVLVAVRRVGPAQAVAILRRHSISELRIVGALTDRQCRELARELREGMHVQEQLIA